MAVPTRFDTEQVWIATSDTVTVSLHSASPYETFLKTKLQLFDFDSESTKGTFHQNTIRIPSPFKSMKSSSPVVSSSLTSTSSSSSASSISSPSSSVVSSSLSSSTRSTSSTSLSSCSLAHSSPPATHVTPKSSFFPTHLPGFGNNYLEFCSHPLAHDVEIIR